MSQEVSSFPKSTQIKTNDLTHGPLGEQSRSNHSSVLPHFRARIGETKEEALTIGENCEEIAPHSVILCVCVCASMQHMPKHHAEATTQKSECISTLWFCVVCFSQLQLSWTVFHKPYNLPTLKGTTQWFLFISIFTELYNHHLNHFQTISHPKISPVHFNSFS